MRARALRVLDLCRREEIFFRVERDRKKIRAASRLTRDILLTRFVDTHEINTDTYIHDDDIKTLFRNDVLRAMIVIIRIIYSNAPTPSIMHK